MSVLQEALQSIRESTLLDDIAMGEAPALFKILVKSIRVQILITALRTTPESEIEAQLNEWFKDLKFGENFEHSEIVIALLYSAWIVPTPYIAEMLRTFGATNTAEISRIRHFARYLTSRKG